MPDDRDHLKLCWAERNHENRPKVAWRPPRYPTIFACLTCITDSLNFVLVSHVLAIVNKQTASALLLESTSSLIQPVCRFTFFYWSCTPNWWFQLFVHNDHRILFLISLLDDCSISHILPSSIPTYFPVIYIERHLSPQLSKFFGIWPCCSSL